jgi:hypothetical protein
MAVTPVIHGSGRLTAREVRELSVEEQERARLLEYGEAGFPIFLARDVDTSHSPYLVADGKVWVAAHGEPPKGRSPKTHAILLEDNGAWGFLILAAACQDEGAPTTVAELEERARRREEARARQAEEAKAELERRRRQATPVTLDDLAHDGERVTLRQAGERVVQAGGRLDVRGSRLVVSLPPGTLLVSGVPSPVAKAAARLYAARRRS